MSTFVHHHRAHRTALATSIAVALMMLCCLMLPARASALYGTLAGGMGADIVSVDNAADEEGNRATIDAVISADGRYVVFQTRSTNLFEDDGGVITPQGTASDVEPPGTLREGGLFRYDRLTGMLQLVSDGSEIHDSGPEKGRLISQGAQAPSVSADGRYVAFDTAQQLVPQDRNDNVDVYVRDMDIALRSDRSSSGAYTLVSARDGGDEPASYAPHSPPLVGAEAGAEVWPNTSVSADGRYVVFRTAEAESDLPDSPTPNTPEDQLFVRDLQTRTTTLLTRDARTGEPVSDPHGPVGAIGPASISADGSTVSWVSTAAPQQTSFLPGEPQSVDEPYYLWRRWQQPGALTRRITGMVDPDDPGCHEGEGVSAADQTTISPCYGPLTAPESSLGSIALSAPGLSADGYTVAFLAGAALRPTITKSGGLDVFLTSMMPGVTRKSGTSELTLSANTGNPGSTPTIDSLALSADGSTITFTSTRTDFVLQQPAPIGMFRAVSGVNDLYVIDLAADTLSRALTNYDGSDPEGPVLVNPTLDASGSTIAFASSASGLIFGDANQVPDAFTVSRLAPAGTGAPPAEVNAAQSGFSISSTSVPELGLTVRRGRTGEAILLVETPTAGRLQAQVSATLGVRGRRRRVSRRLRWHVSGTARSEGTTTLHLRLPVRYRHELSQDGRAHGTVTVSFTPTTGEALSADASVTFYSKSGRRIKAFSKPKKSQKRK